MTAPNTSQALQEMSKILQRDPWDLILFEIHAYMGMFGVWNHRNRSYQQLSPFRDMLAIHFWDRHFLDNLTIAIFMEAVGVGLQHYCILFNSSPNFYSKPKLILYSLPQEKMFIYHANSRQEGPFLQEPWSSRARAIHAHLFLTEEEYVASFVCF